ncbi:MAG: hypothetical protein QOH88_3594 [Verrucomicrobiota bacterium]
MVSRTVLIVSPNFPPTNAADHHRVRISLPFLPEFGWKAIVLAILPRFVEAPEDPLLLRTVPDDVEVHRIAALNHRTTRKFGLGSLALRALPSMLWKGSKLLRSRKIDLVYFSTTQFPLLILGPILRRVYGIPYVIDLQDPWLHDYYESTGTFPPGGKIKHGIARLMARSFEPIVMRHAKEVIVVSPAYAETLLKRYPFFRREQFTTLPFGGSESDFALLSSLEVKHNVFNPNDGLDHWVYVGVAGDVMAPALHLLFSALRKIREGAPDRLRHTMLHFIGTSYAPKSLASKSVEPIARAHGVADLVEERTDRIPYFEALQCLAAAQVILVIGSDAPGYSASKLYPCILANRPLLAILHEKSPAVKILRGVSGQKEVVTFDPASQENALVQLQAVLHRMLDLHGCTGRNEAPAIESTQFAEYTAREMTRRQCDVFDRAAIS